MLLLCPERKRSNAVMDYFAKITFQNSTKYKNLLSEKKVKGQTKTIQVYLNLMFILERGEVCE